MSGQRADQPGPAVRVAFVDVLVLRGSGEALEVLCLRRAPAARSPGSWEVVHGHIDPGETPVVAALREMREETGLQALQLYNLSRVEMFYRHTADEVVLIPVFAVFVPANGQVRVSAEHDRFEWLTPDQARARLAWPRERREVVDAVVLFGDGGAGVLEDVLWVEREEWAAKGER